MGLFDFFKKKEEKEIKDLNIKNLSKGCIVDYEMKSWIVKDVTEYDWGNNMFTFEYILTDEINTLFLHVNDDATLKLDISSPIGLLKLDRNLKSSIVEKDTPIKEITYEGEEYILTDEFLGHCKSTDDGDEDWSKFINWVYHTKNEDKYISVNRWGETDIDAATGKYVKEFMFSNLLSSPNN